MSAFKQLNIDILTQIVKYIDINNTRILCKSLVPIISKDEADFIICYRESPIILLKRLVDEPELLLLGMGFTGVLLSGSQATEYFYPGIISEKSDWDFYCPSDPRLANSFEIFMQSIGVKWIYKINGYENTDDQADKGYYGLDITIGKIEHNNTIHTIQLIRDSKDRCNAFDIIVKFHSSIVQCFISAYGAVCMHNNLTMKGRSIAWNSRIENPSDKEQSKRARSKYISRGIKYTSYEWYANVDQDIQDHCISTEIINTVVRKVGDKNSKVILFNHYYNDEIKTLNILYRDYETQLSMFQNLYWLETPYKCIRSTTDYSALQIPDSLTLTTLIKLHTLYPKLSVVLKLREVGRILLDNPIRMRNMIETLSNLELDIAENDLEIE